MRKKGGFANDHIKHIICLFFGAFVACSGISNEIPSPVATQVKNGLVTDFSLFSEIASEPIVKCGLGRNWYVSPVVGNDANVGTNPQAPFRKVEKALDLVQPGDTVNLLNGDYVNPWQGSDVISIRKSCSEKAYCCLRAAPNHKPRIQVDFHNWAGVGLHGARYWVIEGLQVKGRANEITLKEALESRTNLNNPRTSGNGILVNSTREGTLSSHLIIRKNQVSSVGGGGIAVLDADYITIVENRVSYTSRWAPYGNSGISLFHSRDVDSNFTFKNFISRNSSFRNSNQIPWYSPLNSNGKITDGNGIIVDDNLHTQDGNPPYQGKTLVENNVVFLNGGSGIHAYSSAQVLIRYNTAYLNNVNTDGGQIFMNSSQAVEISNNIMVAPEAKPITSHWNTQNSLFRNNLYWGGLASSRPGGIGDFDADPQFVDPAKFNFRLKSTSPAINKGTLEHYPVQDITGRRRFTGLAPDQGAFESQ